MKSICELFALSFSKQVDPVKILSRKSMEKIFEYLRGRDLLELSLVSKTWYEFIASSPICMDKIRVQITEYFIQKRRKLSNDDVLGMLKHRRKYTNLSLACIRSSEQSFTRKAQNFSPEHKLLMANYKWKSISLCNHQFEEEIDFINFLGFVEPFVEELELRSVKIGNIVGACETNFFFPKLRKLSLANVSNFVYLEVFKNVKDLKELVIATEAFLPTYIDHSEQIKARVKHIKRFLINNSKLEDFEIFLDQKDFNEMFIDVDFAPKLSFRLKNLTVGRFQKLTNEKSNHYQLKNFSKFLRLHSASLEEIFIPDCLGVEVLETVICQMNRLKVLTLHDVEMQENNATSISGLKLAPNKSIESFNIWTRFNKSTEFIKLVVANLPSLKEFQTRIVNQPILDALARFTPNLETITTDFFTASHPTSCRRLEKLTRMNIHIKSNDFYLETIEGKKSLTNFEKVFIESSKRLRRKTNVNNLSFYTSD
jgi:F-box-like